MDRLDEKREQPSLLRIVSAAIAATLLIPISVSAQVQIDAQAAIARNDNINLAFEGGNEIDETIQSLATRFAYNGSTRYTTTSFFGNISYSHFKEGTFDNDLAGGAALDFDMRTADNRFGWIVTDNYGQQSVDPVRLASPGNRRGVNIFRTGPTANIPLGQSNTLLMSAIYTDNSIEQSNADSSRNTGTIQFVRRINTVFSAGIGGSYEAVDFNEVSGVDFDTQSAFLTVSANGRRTTLSVTLGANEVEGSFGEGDGTLFRLNVNRRIGTSGNLAFQVDRGYSDTGNLFRLTQRNTIDVGATQDIVSTTDPFESTTGFVTFTRGGADSSYAIQGFWRKDEFVTQTDFNRNEYGLRVFVRHSIGEKWELMLNGGSVRRDLQELRQDDDTHTWSIQAMRSLGRRFGVGLRADRIMRDQNRPGFDRNSTQYMIFLNFRRQQAREGQQFSQQVF